MNVTEQMLTAAAVPEPFLIPAMDGLARSDALQVGRAACWIAQYGHETQGFTRLVENMNYSAERLVVVFQRSFRSLADAAPYHRQPERIANRVYGGRLGNGPEASGDGWRHRGRGFPHCTGRANYEQCSRWVYGDDKLVADPSRLERPEDGALAGAWFWVTRNLNLYADAHTAAAFRAMTKALNGAYNGLPDRWDRWRKARAAFGLSPPPDETEG